MAHGDAREGKCSGNWRMEWVASTLHTTSQHVAPSITTADSHNSAASIRLNLRPRRFKWTRPFRRKTKSCFCVCAIKFQTQSTKDLVEPLHQSSGNAGEGSPETFVSIRCSNYFTFSIHLYIYRSFSSLQA